MEADELARLAGWLDDARPADDKRNPVGFVVHHRPLVEQAVRACEIAVVRGVDHDCLVGHAEFIEGIENPADLIVDQRHKPEVVGDGLAPRLPVEVLDATVVEILFVDARFSTKGFGEVTPRLDLAWVVHRRVRFGDDVGMVRAEKVCPMETGAIVVDPAFECVDCHLGQKVGSGGLDCYRICARD